MSLSYVRWGERWDRRCTWMLTNPLLLRIVWQIVPSLPICLLFWVAAIRFDVVLMAKLENAWSRRLAWVSLAGLLMNATVTVANGGFMPVVGDATSFSLWVTSAEANRLLWLADHTSWWGFSVGDGFIIGGHLTRGVLALGRAGRALWAGVIDARHDDRQRDAARDARYARLMERRGAPT